MRQLMKDGKGGIGTKSANDFDGFIFADSGFVMLQGTTYWTDLFVRHFLFQNESSIDCDDLLFFVRKKHVKGSPRYLPKFEVSGPIYLIRISHGRTINFLLGFETLYNIYL